MTSPRNARWFGPAILVGVAAWLSPVRGQELPNVNGHMGVASCASSVCHGKSTAQMGNGDLRLHEYSIWLHSDRHSQAFNRLKSDVALRIGEKLNIANPSTAKICVTCHADTQATGAAPAKSKFLQSDGVGCEACHGGSEHWLEFHSQAAATHRQNIARGMYPTEQPLQRATLCLSCHLGTRDRFATHMIMAAGHPRLSFELEAFTANQPRHYQVDADYVKRKGEIGGMNLWVTGQLESAERYLTLLNSPLMTAHGILPELAFYDCFACHHSLQDQRWTRERVGPGLEPGLLRLQHQNFAMLGVLAAVIAPESVASLQDGVNALLRGGQADPAALHAAVAHLMTTLRGFESWSTRRYSDAETAQVRKGLVRLAADDHASDFAVAEQVEMGMESLSYTLKDYPKRKAALDVLYDKVTSASAFSPNQFRDAARKIEGQF
jgi:hypothetical protein